MVPLPRAFLDRPIAHRGLHRARDGRPENSRAAVAAAIAGGYGIEIDLQLSADGVAMVFHDAALDRLTDATGPLAARTAADLAAIPLRHGSETIPTFAEILACVAGRVPLLVEIKDQDGALGPGVGALEAAAAADLAGYAGPVALMSFNPHAVAALARAAPGLPRGLVTCAFPAAEWPDVPAPVRDRLRAIPDAGPTGASFVSHDARDLDNPRLAELAAQGVAILCWTIRSAEAEAAARRVAANVTFEGYAA
ncbi:glycerophosphodiester phosphodiesterase family protein [Roseivivax isoporae]|uniref:Phosphodiesterase n=1 Tax=Roseivivax isoporae LMG 25204 TaxID=1449351 RepID=X7F7I3_9RHOB|nr:glycerophosphodiester phosphodiesterase family protein [Roseivivax isoporae]ETX28021.1 phosphodiesterase [Roseivivax isoporae LMG 25204]